MNKSDFIEHLKPLLPAGGDASELETAAQALAGLSLEDRDLLAAVQESPYRLTTLEQFREFPDNTEYFVLEPRCRLRDSIIHQKIIFFAFNFRRFFCHGRYDPQPGITYDRSAEFEV